VKKTPSSSFDPWRKSSGTTLGQAEPVGGSFPTKSSKNGEQKSLLQRRVRPTQDTIKKATKTY
jgi:hypothetical protein